MMRSGRETSSTLLSNAGDMFNDHLKAVQRVLEEWGEPEPICRAGLFHSIFGTQGNALPIASPQRLAPDPLLRQQCLHAGFQDFQLPLSRREDVKRLIGEVLMSQQ